ncbi:hypothetical protein [Amycolatopsis anabasis]|uniref:hypothetical protein n=1 Tax=Amycolatopsis anabasis TaxID=1840409 RepID=UPI00131D3D80|nr:hypothetical protein [Amycolatopsis anabasis]
MAGEPDFVEVGRQAFLAGEPATPALNATVARALADLEYARCSSVEATMRGADIMRQFQQGWTEANLASEVTVHFGSPVNPGRTACASRVAEPVMTENPRAVNCCGCRETEDWRSYADMAEFADLLPEATDTEPDKIVILREVRDKFVMRKIEGVVMEPQTANAILTVYDSDAAKNKEGFREKFAALPILRMAEVAWKLVK